MSALITINFAGGTAASNNVFVILTNCAVAPGAQSGVVVAMASGLTNISIFAGQVGIATATGGKFDGSVAIEISWSAGSQPIVTLNNLQNSTTNPATVTWPTAGGPETQILSPGDPMVLTGIVDS